MSKIRATILLLFFLFSLVLALEWKTLINAIDKAYKLSGLNTPTVILSIIERESSFGENLGVNLGSKEKNINRCVNMCFWRKETHNIDGRFLVACYNRKKQEYTIDERRDWCNEQYKTLEKITKNLGLDINKVPIAPDFGIGYTQFQPTTWILYPELKNKNPWNLEDSLYAAALKLVKDGVNKNEEQAVCSYNCNKDELEKYKDAKQDWEQILQDTIFVYDCSNNDYSCALSVIKDRFLQCTENNWSIRKKKECLKTEVAKQKEIKLANLEKQKQFIELNLVSLGYVESTPLYLGQNYLPPSNYKLKVVLKSNNQNNNAKDFQNNSSQTSKEEILSFSYQEERKKPEVTKSLNKNLNLKSTPTITNQFSKSTSTEENKKESNLNLESLLSELKINQRPTTPIKTSGSDIRTANNQPQQPKDPCENYKNKQYPNILISEIQYETPSSTQDEYIELYNPTNEEIDLTCWKLEKYSSKDNNSTSTPNLYTLIPQSKFQGKIKPNSFFLISAEEYKDKYQADLTYAKSYSISKNNTIVLRKPNGEISDLVGYGDDKEKIYQYEAEPFIITQTNADNNRTIQRKNLQDTNNNSQDFWLRKANPENSNSPSRIPREDFIDLSQVKIENFRISIETSTEINNLVISFKEPNLNVSSTNYFYEIKLESSSSSFSTSTLQANFNSEERKLNFPIENCNFLLRINFYLKDRVDEENYLATTSEINLQDLGCSQNILVSCNLIDHSLDNLENATSGKVFISEVMVIEGINNNQGEFIELYNPNDYPVNISGWSLVKINKNGNFSENKLLAPTKIKAVIPPFSYFLIGNKETCNLNSNFSFDYLYPSSTLYGLTFNNGLALLNEKNEIVDYLCWGEVDNYQNCLNNPPEGKSIERKKLDRQANNLDIDLNSWGNGYLAFDENGNYLIKESFEYRDPQPENSLIFKPLPKNFLNFRGFIVKEETDYKIFDENNNLIKSGKINYHNFNLRFNFISPALYFSSTTISLNQLSSDYESLGPLEKFAFYPLKSYQVDFDIFLQNLEGLLFSLELTKEIEGETITLVSSTPLSWEKIDPEMEIKNVKADEGGRLLSTTKIPLREIVINKNQAGQTLSFKNFERDYLPLIFRFISSNENLEEVTLKYKKENETEFQELKLKKANSLGVKTICNNKYLVYYYLPGWDNLPQFEANKNYYFLLENNDLSFFEICPEKDYLFEIYGGDAIRPS
ncbi:hypothetical protein HRbin35_00427 [bacterium HR35]|nr:hypothetical protein HRbin35_00427 [bacterium HR35]